MILGPILAAAVAAAQPAPQPPAPEGYARSAVELQLARRPVRRPATGLTGAEAQAMRKAYLDQLAEKREAAQAQDVIGAPAVQ